MKALQLKSILIAAAIFGLAAGSAVAGPTQDSFEMAYTSPNSSKETELGYFAEVAEQSFAASAYGSAQGRNGATYDTDKQLWVITLDLPQAQLPSYFLLKFGLPALDDEEGGQGGGKGKGNDKPKNKFNTAFDTYVFKNIGEMNQLVWSNADVNFLSGGDCTTSDKDGPCNIERLSHISWVTGGAGVGTPGGGEVPEPASLALLGAGLAGMALRRRRRG